MTHFIANEANGISDRQESIKPIIVYFRSYCSEYKPSITQIGISMHRQMPKRNKRAKKKKKEKGKQLKIKSEQIETHCEWIIAATIYVREIYYMPT